MKGIGKAIAAPWKGIAEIGRIILVPYVQLVLFLSGVRFPPGGRFFGVPIIMRHGGSTIDLGPNAQLRSSRLSNPLSPNHRVVVCTWEPGARITTGANFGMTGGVLCAAVRIEIGNNVLIGANSTIADTDFHPLSHTTRMLPDAAGKAAPVVVEDDVFIGMNCLVLKGVRIGRGAVIGAGAVVTRDVPPYSVAAGNPARVVGQVNSGGGAGESEI